VSELVLPQTPARYLRDARLAREGDALHLHVIAWNGEVGASAREQHLRFGVDAEPLGVSSEPEVVYEAASIAALSLSGGDAPRVADAGEGEVATAGTERVLVERDGGTSRVVLERGARGRRRRVVVWEARATAAAPALARGASGSWIAFHHNLREDTREADLTKWIALRFVSDRGAVLEPAAPMTDRDRDRAGEEQGFELPTLVAHEDGAVTLFGRGSHRFYRQTLDARGFGPRVALGDGTWGCRGRRVAALVHRGVLVTARRERAGIVVATATLEGEGAPGLVPATVALDARPHRDVPPRPSAPDPAAARGQRTLFGDIHQHSARSDGCGTEDEPYLRARWVYGDDFGALSDHESFLGKRISPGEWGALTAAADRHDAPGTFATLLAYEWTGRMHPGPGHKVVYVPHASHDIVSRDAEPTGEGLVRRLRGSGAIAVPHHVGWTGADEAAHDPSVQPIWEICSCHGCYLSEGHPLGQRGELRDEMIERVLARGRRFGFIACSDGHGLLFHHGVARKRDPFRTGLTAVQATECTREAVLEALVARRCYATSGVPIFLDVDAEGAPMGSEVHLPVRGALRVRVSAAAATEIAELALIGAAPDQPAAVHARTQPRADRGTLEAEVGVGWWYARVTTESGEMAWSSPVFVDP
jgi:hypothetical protein